MHAEVRRPRDPELYDLGCLCLIIPVPSIHVCIKSRAGPDYHKADGAVKPASKERLDQVLDVGVLVHLVRDAALRIHVSGDHVRPVSRALA